MQWQWIALTLIVTSWMQILVLHDFTIFHPSWVSWPGPYWCRAQGPATRVLQGMAAMAGDPSPVAGVVPRCGHQANMEKDQAIDALEPNTYETNGHFDREHHDDPLEFWGYTIVSFSLGCLRYARACQRVPVPADVYRWLDFLQLTTRSDDQLNSVCWAQKIPFTLYESSDRPFISS